MLVHSSAIHPGTPRGVRPHEAASSADLAESRAVVATQLSADSPISWCQNTETSPAANNRSSMCRFAKFREFSICCFGTLFRRSE